MKLYHYFEDRRAQHLSDGEKARIYQQVLARRGNFQTGLQRSSLLRKKLVYSFLASVLVFAVFWTYFRDALNITNYRAFWTQKNPIVSVVNANQVAKIIAINGDYIIEKDGKQFKNSVIFDGDVITLKNRAKIIFNINEDVKIQIEWPAQFVVTQKVNGGYHLNLIEGDFLKIETPKMQDILAIETEEFTFETQKDQIIDLEINRMNERVLVKNSGDAVVITTKATDTEPSTSTELSRSKMLTLTENDISKIEDIDSFRQVLVANSNITHTTTASVQTGATQDDLIKEIWILIAGDLAHKNALLDQQNALGINEQIEYRLDDKKIPTEAQLSHISATLNGQFLMADMASLYEALLHDDSAQTQASFRWLSVKIEGIAKQYEINIGAVGQSLAWLEVAISQLVRGLEKYHLPPTKLQQLNQLKNWFTYLKVTTLEQEWEVFKQELPAQLQFN